MVGLADAMTVSRPVRVRVERLLRRLEWPLAILALLVVPALILEDRTTNPALRWLCNIVNWFVWVAFVGEFVTALTVAANRRKYLQSSWFDLAIILFSPPFLVPDALQGTRSLRALRILRLLRFRSSGWKNKVRRHSDTSCFFEAFHLKARAWRFSGHRGSLSPRSANFP
jgi:ion transport protein